MFRLATALFAIVVAIIALVVFVNAIKAAPVVQALQQEGR